MSFDSPWFFVAAGIVLAMLVWLASHYFSRDARLSRRRRRNNYPVRPKVSRPMIKFSVSTKKAKKKPSRTAHRRPKAENL